MATPPDAPFAPRNRLLAALAPDEAARLRPHLTPVSLPSGQVLVEADEPFPRVYFPETGVVSVVCAFTDGPATEMTTVGNEGLVGVTTVLDDEIAPGRCLVQVPGTALSVEIAAWREVLRASPALRALCLAYVRALIAQLLQTVACNSVHTVEERCGRWLLMTHDRSGGDSFLLTQAFLTQMLGVQRPTVSLAARTLQRAGLIRYSRGRITVVDRPGLEEVACLCYRLIRSRYERHLPHAFA